MTRDLEAPTSEHPENTRDHLKTPGSREEREPESRGGEKKKTVKTNGPEVKASGKSTQ